MVVVGNSSRDEVVTAIGHQVAHFNYDEVAIFVLFSDDAAGQLPPLAVNVTIRCRIRLFAKLEDNVLFQY